MKIQLVNFRRALRIGFVVASVFFLALVRVAATTVFTVQHQCPACGERFLGKSIGSWFQFEPVGDDFSGSSFTAGLTVETCPHCLFSAMDLEKLSPAARKRVTAALARLPEGLAPIEQPRGARRSQRMELAASRVQARLAELCSAHMDPDPSRDALFALRAYYGADPGADKLAATRRAVTALGAWLADETIAKQRPDLVYLRGELQRRAGATRDAAATLRLAATLAKGANDGIAEAALKQRKLAEKGITESRDPARPASESDAERMAELRKRLPAFIAALRRGRASREWLLPEKHWDPVHNTMAAANKLVEQGDRAAVEYVLRWLAQLDEAELDDYPEPYCLQALAGQPELAKPLLPKLTFRCARMSAAARYACGAAEAPPETRAALAGKAKWLPTDKGVLMAAKIRRDPSFKPLLLSKSVSSERWPAWEAESYLIEMASAEDIPAIERRIRGVRHPRDVSEYHEATSHREDLESVLLQTRLRDLARKLQVVKKAR